MKKEQGVITYWWEKLYPLRRKFVRETIISGMEKEDLEQECFIQLQQALERYKPELGVPFESYYKVRLYGWRANQNRVRARTELAFGEESLFFLVDERVHIEEDVEIKVLMEEVYRYLEELEEKEKFIIKAYYLQHKKLVEIASILNMPIKTVEGKKKRALDRIRKLIEQYYEEMEELMKE